MAEISRGELLADYYQIPHGAAEALGVGDRTIWRYISLGEFPPTVKVGARRYVSKEGMRRWLTERETAE